MVCECTALFSTWKFGNIITLYPRTRNWSKQAAFIPKINIDCTELPSTIFIVNPNEASSNRYKGRLTLVLGGEQTPC